MKSTTSLTALFVLAVLFAHAQNESALTGIWHNNDFGYQMTLMLNPDGSGEFDGEQIRYSLKGNQLNMSIAGESILYSYALSGNTLKLSGGDLDSPIAFNKGGNAGGSGVVSTSEPPSPPNNPTTPDGGTNALIGIWSGSGETIEFKNNRQCSYLGNTFGYHATESQVTLTASDGSVSFGYSIEGNQLIITGASGKVTYTKGGASTPGGTGTKGVAMELVGKWCWINVNSTNTGGSTASRCITLNGNGTYSYEAERSMSVNTEGFYGGTNSQNSDQGTWFVQGDRLHYNSQKSGQGSYRLEKRNHPKNVNDPMIVLDGETYVTQTYRQPWR